MLAAIAIALCGMRVAPADATSSPPESTTQQAVPRPDWTVAVTETTPDLGQHLSALPSLQFSPVPPPTGVPVVSVNDRARFQQVNGFGGAMTDSSAWLMYDELPVAARAELMSDLFGASGIGLSFVRLPIGASDFTVTGHPYTYDDLPPGQTDPTLAQFSIAHDELYVVPSLIAMLTVNPRVQIIATPWTAPPWMKANDGFDDLEYSGTLLAADYAPLAAYFVRFLQAYAALGIPIGAITPENEPLNRPPYPGMFLPEPAEAQWISQDLVPALRTAGLSPKIYGYDGGWSGYGQTLAAGPAGPDLAGLAWHCYGGLGLLSRVHATFPRLDQIVTECSPGLARYPVPEMLIGALRNWATSVGLWNLALDPSGGPVQPPNTGCMRCTGVVTVDERTHTFTLNRNYFQLGQLSRFIQPGAWQIGANNFVTYYRTATGGYGATNGLDDAAVLNPDGTRVLVAYNNSPHRIRFAVKWDGNTFTFGLSAHGTVTFSWG